MITALSGQFLSGIMVFQIISNIGHHGQTEIVIGSFLFAFDLMVLAEIEIGLAQSFGFLLLGGAVQDVLPEIGLGTEPQHNLKHSHIPEILPIRQKPEPFLKSGNSLFRMQL